MSSVSSNPAFIQVWQKMVKIDQAMTLSGDNSDPHSTTLEENQRDHSNGEKEILYVPPKERIQMQDAHTEILYKVWKTWFSRAEDIVEVGCGKLNKDGRSFTTMFMPNYLASKFTYSDLNNAVNPFKHSKFFQGSFTQLGTIFQKRRFDAVVASCTLDTIGTDELTTALKEIGKVLAKNGVLICLSDQMPYISTIIDHYIKRNMILFPYIDKKGHIKGFQVVSPENLEKHLKSDRLSSEEKDYLAWYKKLNINRVDCILTFLLTNFFDDAKKLSNWTSLQKIEGAEIILNEDFYHANLRRGLSEAGFEIKAFKDMDESVITKANAVKNYMFFDKGHVFEGRNYVLAPGHVYRRMRLHLVVAQKKEI